ESTSTTRVATSSVVTLPKQTKKATSTTATPPKKTTTSTASSSVVSQPATQYDLGVLAHAISDAVNQERAKRGLAALSWNQPLANIAEAHSQNQAKDNVVITNTDLLCQYPLIRHDEFDTGFNLKDR